MKQDLGSFLQISQRGFPSKFLTLGQADFTHSTASRIPIALRIAEMLVSSGFPSTESIYSLRHSISAKVLALVE